jgi:hypothetical protein
VTALVGVVAELVVGEMWFEVVVGAVVGGPWVQLGLDNLAVEAASQEDSLGGDIGSPEEGKCAVEEDGIHLVHRTEAEDIDSYNILVAEADIDALEGTLEIAAPVVEEQ